MKAMKHKLLITAVAALCCLLCGCTSWMDGNYTSITPHKVEASRLPKESVEVRSYQELEQALTDFIEDCGTKGVFYTNWLHQDSEPLMKNAVEHIMNTSAIAAYAVEDIHYELGTNAGMSAIAVEITYHYDRSEILRIKQADGMEDVREIITAALESCDPSAVMQVQAYESVDLVQLVQDYVDTHPNTCMEMPQISAAVYPEEGENRIIALNFTYQTSRDTLRSMQQTVAQVFSSAALYVSADAESWEKAEQLYSFLMERYHYTLQTSITPAYSLLRHGVGDSKAFATVYAAMCRQVGLDCSVVSGTKDGESRYWNVLVVDDAYYHIDLLQSSSSGRFLARSASQMTGYVWDYSALPDQ